LLAFNRDRWERRNVKFFEQHPSILLASASTLELENGGIRCDTLMNRKVMVALVGVLLSSVESSQEAKYAQHGPALLPDDTRAVADELRQFSETSLLRRFTPRLRRTGILARLCRS
jgi:hypothetical protein